MPDFFDTGLDVVDAFRLEELSAVNQEDRPGPHIRRLVGDTDVWEGSAPPDVVVRPSFVHWVLPGAAGTETFLRAQTRTQRARTASALRRVRGSLEECVYDPVDPAAYREWAEVYASQAAGYKTRHNLAARYRREVLDPDGGHVLLIWRDRGRCVGGCVVKLDRGRSAAVARFGAVAADWKSSDVVRGMYARIAHLAEENGLHRMTLGTDINFFGAMLRPGLCTFKLRLGMRPVPADLFGVDACTDLTERLVGLDGLDVPVLRHVYRRRRARGLGVDDFLAGPDMLELTAAAPDGAANTVITSLPEHRMLTVR